MLDLSVFVVSVVVVVGWESTSLNIIVSLWSSASVKVELWSAIRVKWVVESLGCVLVSLRLFDSSSMSPVVLLKHLFVDDLIVVILSLDHSSLWLKIWSGVMLVLQMIFWHIGVSI